MKKARFTEEQIIGFLREQETGMTNAAGVARASSKFGRYSL